MTIFNRRVPIHETEDGEYPIGMMLGALDEMLTQYRVPHSFSYASDKEQQEAREAKGK